MPPIEDLVAAAVAELRRQEETSGCTVSADGDIVQVDGSFDVRKVVEALVAAADSSSA
jgi:hypothetical protein